MLNLRTGQTYPPAGDPEPGAGLPRVAVPGSEGPSRVQRAH